MVILVFAGIEGAPLFNISGDCCCISVLYNLWLPKTKKQKKNNPRPCLLQWDPHAHPEPTAETVCIVEYFLVYIVDTTT